MVVDCNVEGWVDVLTCSIVNERLLNSNRMSNGQSEVAKCYSRSVLTLRIFGLRGPMNQVLFFRAISVQKGS